MTLANLASNPPPASDQVPIEAPEDLERIFHEAEKPRSEWRIGSEAEKFGVDAQSGAPLAYDGPRGVVRVMSALVAEHGWVPERETPDGPLIALKRERASVTLEPGAQLELSGAPQEDVHAICAEMRGHLNELFEISSEMNLLWLGIGFHPLASQAALPWVPKLRYRIMREYLPGKGSGAIDMMRRTATVQANFDYESEEDALRKLRVSLVLSPLIHAMTANSPFIEGRLAGKKSVRGEVWLHMDQSRSGLIPALWQVKRLRYRDYVEWALDAGMFLIKRDGQVIENTGQTFRSFLSDGYQGQRATIADWKLHLQTLFPEARLKSTLEVRSADSLPTPLACAIPALYTGVLYDPKSLDAAEAFAERFDYAGVEASRPALVSQGLGTSIAGRPARELALELLEIAAAGLERRARLNKDGKDERIHLERLTRLNEAGQSPADQLTEGLSADDPDLSREILARAQV